MAERWGNRESRKQDVGIGQHTCDGEVSLLIFDDRILDDLLELGSEVTWGKDQVTNAARV